MSMTLLKQSPQKCFNPQHIDLPTLDIPAISARLQQFGCNGCQLGEHPYLKSPVVYRGNVNARKMIIGEAPGKDENIQTSPFVGPAGELLDRIFSAVEWDTNADWYLGNIVKCRPFAPAKSSKQNTTPTETYRRACRPYIEREITLLQPHTIVLLGQSAAKALLGKLVGNKYMYQIAGRVFTNPEWPTITFFVMYHPAALLHAQNYPEKSKQLRQATWEHVNLLKEIVSEQEMLHE